MHSGLKRYLVAVVWLGVHLLCASEAEVEKLLDGYMSKNDLSQQTLEENKGHLVLFTRERLEKMRAKTLKDVFKTTPVVYYHENRHGLPDPLASGALEPYRSDFIRLYIDGVEISQGWLGSGIVLYGDMNIDFVDHIEFYYMTPSMETSTEPAYLTIFIYSKEAKRDKGATVNLLAGSRGYNTQSISYGDKKENYSYMLNFSHTDAKRQKIDNGTATPLSRDFERTQIFSYIKSENQMFHLQVMQKKSDGFAGLSLDATPLVSQLDSLNIHADYRIDLSEHWRLQLSYGWLKTDILEEDDTPLANNNGVYMNSLDIQLKSSISTAELTYKNSFGKHRVATGLKARVKKLDSVKIDTNLNIPFDEEGIYSLFFQDQYKLNDISLLTLGLSYNKFIRNGGMEDDDLFQLRLGYILKDDKWSYKSYLYRSMFAISPFNRYINNGIVRTDVSHVEPQVTLGFTNEVSYKEDDYRLRLMFLMMRDENGLLDNSGEGNTKYFFTIANYDYNFDRDNKMNLQVYYAVYEDIGTVDRLEDFSGFLSFRNTYEDFELYNAMVWHHNTIDYVYYFDVTSSITWNISKDLSLALEGQNLLNQAKKSNLFRINPSTGQLLQPLNISPIDQRITLELEYRF